MNYMFGQCCASAQREHDMQERLLSDGVAGWYCVFSSTSVCASL
jgi:hypothetical protein